MFCIRFFFHQPRLLKLGPFVEMPWTRCNLVTGHNRIRSEPQWMSGECEEVDKWLRPQILINLFEVRSPQAMNLLKSGASKQGNCQTNDHARHGQKKKKNRGFSSIVADRICMGVEEKCLLLRYLVRFDTQQRRSSRVRRWSKKWCPLPPRSTCVWGSGFGRQKREFPNKKSPCNYTSHVQLYLKDPLP